MVAAQPRKKHYPTDTAGWGDGSTCQSDRPQQTLDFYWISSCALRDLGQVKAALTGQTLSHRGAGVA